MLPHPETSQGQFSPQHKLDQPRGSLIYVQLLTAPGGILASKGYHDTVTPQSCSLSHLQWDPGKEWYRTHCGGSILLEDSPYASMLRCKLNCCFEQSEHHKAVRRRARIWLNICPELKCSCSLIWIFGL